jgi:putative pyruvate formate lyase activating enzyme
VAAAHPHFGEEAPLVGRGGSGTIFFTHCNLHCIFCQNFEISHLAEGKPLIPKQLAQCMLGLQAQGCANINIVTPSHVVPQILAAVLIAARNGLRIPLVYNSSAYDTLETLRLLDGVVDIYMPDFKFWDPAVAQTLCQAADYPEVARRALTEMHRQVGDMQIDNSGMATRGLLVRHLVMPENVSSTAEIMAFLAQHISPATYVNIMPQYRPCGRAAEIPQISRTLTSEEYQHALRSALDAGLTRLDPPRPLLRLR